MSRDVTKAKGMADQITFKFTLDTDELEFEIETKGKANPERNQITQWNCEVVPVTFDLQIHKYLLHAIQRLQRTFEDRIGVSLTSIRNRKQLFIFAFGHDTRDDALQVATKFSGVKDTILKFIQENDANVSDISLRCCEGVQKGKTATPTPTRSDPKADSEFHEACKTVNLADIKRILEAGRTDVNCRDERGVTPVMRAAGDGHKELVQFLISEGADLSLVDDDGDNTLHWVCSGGDVETVKFVLSQNMEVTNAMHRKTAADMARRRGHQEVVDLLVSRGAQ